MKWDIDRLNALLTYYGRTPFDRWSQQHIHSVLDELDRQAGRDTSGAICRCHWRATGVPVNTVGARIRQHERRLGW